MLKTRRIPLLFVMLVVLLVIAFYLTTLARSDGFIDPFADQGRLLQGKTVYTANCAACHGANLEGQANWRERLDNGRLPAPPHDKTGHTWHHPDRLLVDMVKHGLVPGRTAPPGYESDMPAYGGLLTDEEIVAVIAYIKSTWPPRVLEAQKEVTLRNSK
nr:cytochrome c [Neopusillimonas maritima]